MNDNWYPRWANPHPLGVDRHAKVQTQQQRIKKEREDAKRLLKLEKQIQSAQVNLSYLRAHRSRNFNAESNLRYIHKLNQILSLKEERAAMFVETTA